MGYRYFRCPIHNVQFVRKGKLGLNLGKAYDNYFNVRVCITCIREARAKVRTLICQAREARNERQRNRP